MAYLHSSILECWFKASSEASSASGSAGTGSLPHDRVTEAFQASTGPSVRDTSALRAAQDGSPEFVH